MPYPFERPQAMAHTVLCRCPMTAKLSLDGALAVLPYYADQALQQAGVPKSTAALRQLEQAVLSRLDIPAAERAYVENLVASHLMRKADQPFPGVPRFQLLSGGLGGRFQWDLLQNARTDVLRGLKSWDTAFELKHLKHMEDGKAFVEWNSWTTPNPHRAENGAAYQARIGAEREQHYRGTPMAEDLHPTPGLAEALSISRMVDAAKEFPFGSTRPALVAAILRQGLSRGIIHERRRLSEQQPGKVAASALQPLSLSKEIDAVLELVEQRFDFHPRLYHEPSKKPGTVFEKMVPLARARLAAEESAPTGKGSKATADQRLLVATLLMLGEQLGSSLVSVGFESAPKHTDLFAKVVDRAFA